MDVCDIHATKLGMMDDSGDGDCDCYLTSRFGDHGCSGLLVFDLILTSEYQIAHAYNMWNSMKWALTIFSFFSEVTYILLILILSKYVDS